MEVQPKTEEVESQKKVNPRIWYLLSLFFFLLLGLLLYFYLVVEGEDKVVVEVPEIEESRRPEGEVYLTLSPKGEGNLPNIYKLDLETLELEELFTESEDVANLMVDFSPDGERMVFVRFYSGSIDGMTQIMVSDVGLNEVIELTDLSKYRPRNPRFSPDGEKIIYWVPEPPNAISTEPEGNSIYIVDIESKESERVASGAFPLFSYDNSSIFYMKNEGLYSLNLDFGEEYFFFPMTDEHIRRYQESLGEDEELYNDLPNWTNFRFNFSLDRQLVVFTEVFNSQVIILEMFGWDSWDREAFLNTVWESSNRDNNPYGPNWPVWSPDGEYIAMQEFDIDNPAEPQLVIFSLEEDRLERLLEFSLRDYEREYIWITDLVK